MEIVVVLELPVVVVVVEAVAAVAVEEVAVDLLAALQILQTFHRVQCNRKLWAQHSLLGACYCIPS